MCRYLMTNDLIYHQMKQFVQQKEQNPKTGQNIQQ